MVKGQRGSTSKKGNSLFLLQIKDLGLPQKVASIFKKMQQLDLK